MQSDRKDKTSISFTVHYNIIIFIIIILIKGDLVLFTRKTTLISNEINVPFEGLLLRRTKSAADQNLQTDPS